MNSLIKIFLFTFPLYAQYPADSLYNDPNNNVFQKMLIYPITQWQRISYNSSKIGCQFYPNCSLYGAEAIHDHGPLSGLFITSDRIIRCSPFAKNSHRTMNGKYHIDGRLVDPVNIFDPIIFPLKVFYQIAKYVGYATHSNHEIGISLGVWKIEFSLFRKQIR